MQIFLQPQSIYYFSHVLKKMSPDTPMDYVINLRMDKAKILLITEPQRQSREVAYEVGYEAAAF